MSNRANSWSVVGAAVAVAILLVGCQGSDYDAAGPDHESVTRDAAANAAAAPAVLELRQEAETILANADRVDGAEDHVVSKCPGCQLAMDGSADHAAQVGDYELHFCSEGCSKRFQEDTEASILALSVAP